MLTTDRPPRPRLTGRILLLALADVFGLACLAIGGAWFTHDPNGQPVRFLAHFPSGNTDALVAILGGIAVVFWAVSRILREIGKQGDELQARYQTYLQRNYPEQATRIRPDEPPTTP